MKTLVLLVLLVLIGLGAYLYFEKTPPSSSPPLRSTNETSPEKRPAASNETGSHLSWDAEDIKRELEKSGKVVRQKMEKLGKTVADATADARITAIIKGKLLTDPKLSALSITVNTTDGIVTLSGSVSAYEDIGKAMQIALQTEGVREVTSTLQVHQKR